MSESPIADSIARPGPTKPAGTTLVDDGAVGALLGLLDDADCRGILDATGDAALSAGELAETCDIPRSTLYRKLERLTDAGLLEERIRIKRSGKHTSEYCRRVEDVVISIDGDDGVSLAVSRRETPRPPTPFG